MADYKAVIKDIPTYTVYYKRYVAESIDAFFHISQEDNFLMDLSDQVLAENPQIALTEPDYNVMIYEDGAFSDHDIHYLYCDAVTEKGKDCEDYAFDTLEGGTAVTVMHKGPYRRLGEAHAFARNWIEANGYQQAGPPRDSAIDGCWNQDSEEDYLTEVQIPVKRIDRR